MKKTHDRKVKMLVDSGEHAIPVVVPKGKKVMFGTGEHAIFVKNLEKGKRKALTLFKNRG